VKIHGRVWKFGDDIDTDLIIPARYLNVSDASELAKSCFADLRPEFAREVSPGDIIVAGKNFGSGSSREHAPLAIKASGIGVIIAESYARIFYRNAFNIGLPLVESSKAVAGLADGDSVAVDITAGTVEKCADKTLYRFSAIPEFMARLIAAGGLVEHIRFNKIKKNQG